MTDDNFTNNTFTVVDLDKMTPMNDKITDTPPLPPQHWNCYFPLSCNMQILPSHALFGLLFCPFCIYFTLLTSLYCSFFLFLPFFFHISPLFTTSHFYTVPPNDTGWIPSSPERGWIYTEQGGQLCTVFCGPAAAAFGDCEWKDE